MKFLLQLPRQHAAFLAATMVAARLLACAALGFALDYHNGNYNTAVDDVLYDTVIPASESPMTVGRSVLRP